MRTLLLLFVFFASSALWQIPNRCKDEPEKATVYFYRVKEANAARKGETGLTLDGVRLFQMPKATYIGFLFVPGKYSLTMGHRETDLLLNAQAGKRYFFRVSNTAAGFSQLQMLTEIAEEQALHQMEGLKPLAASNVKTRMEQRCDLLKQ